MSYTLGTPYALDIDDYAIPVYSDGHDVAYIYLDGVDDMMIHFHTRSFVPEAATRELMAGMGMHQPDLLRELQGFNGVAATEPTPSIAPEDAISADVAEDIAVNRAGEGETLWNMPEKLTGYVVGGKIPELVFPWDTADTVIGEMVSNHFITHAPAVVTSDCVGWWRYKDNIHVDVNDWVETLQAARALGMAREQISIWDIARGVEIFL